MKKTAAAALLLLAGGCSQAAGHEVDTFEHIHGLEFDREQADTLHVSTHHGVKTIDQDGVWRDPAEHEEQHDLMGFTLLEDNTMVSSGHPSHDSDLQDPIGFIRSTDSGASWEQTALEGEVDFHLMDVNRGDENRLYGINAADSAFYRSEDGGLEWDRLDASNLPEQYPDLISLVSNPENPDHLLISGRGGIYASTDAGDSWEAVDQARVMVSAAASSSGLYAYTADAEGGSLMMSEDFGESWNDVDLTLDDDVVLHIAPHPEEDGKLAVGTAEEDVYVTDDGGQSWIQLAEQGQPVEK
ncbi:F510_1955 family glycosylhydrolase [Bacillus daqingensis]|uniref:F510_1955 family glycosylhydrolase n=1 Tax=Bacillus daqingensis TaxID=872396 RepID=A0ABV9NXI0_9BACI